MSRKALGYGMLANAYYVIRTIFLAVFSCHVIATMHIYSTNLALYERMVPLLGMQLLTLPNEGALPALLLGSSAGYAAVFISLTVGTSISILFLATSLLGYVFRSSKKRTRLACVFGLSLFWTVVVLSQWWKTGDIFISLYFLVVPSVLVLHCRMTVGRPFFVNESLDRVPKVKYLTPVFALLIVIIGTTSIIPSNRLSKDSIISFRDNTLYEMALGRSIADFYYRYTLFAANAIKPIYQRVIKTVHIDISDSDSAQEKTLSTGIIEANLAQAGYIFLPSVKSADVVIQMDGDNVVLELPSGGDKQRVSRAVFENNAVKLVGEFLKNNDRLQHFRAFLKISVLLGLPGALIVLLFFTCTVIGSFLLSLLVNVRPYRLAQYDGAPVLLGALLSLSVIFSLLSSLGVNSHSPRVNPLVAEDDISLLLGSEDWRTRVDALQFLYRQKRSWNHGALPLKPNQLSESTHVAERYWFAMALSQSVGLDADEQLRRLLDDSHINVVCAALNSIGGRAGSVSINDILSVLSETTHWYVQWYAYMALQRLGWINQPKPRNPA